MHDPEADSWHMARALELAARGEGLVEPNPMVGCTVVRDGENVGEGFHRRFGGPHAEVEALEVAGSRARGATAFVTLEPCCHQGKTPPCTKALIRGGVARVVVAQLDPFEQVAGRGIAELEAAGIEVELGLRQGEARGLNAPYRKLVTTGRPWIIAKWAMTLDGKLATHAHDSRWVSCEDSRAVAHRIRGRVDGIMIGRGTAEADDPLLTARPPGARTAVRIVLDSGASLSVGSQLVRTAGEVPLIVAIAEKAPQANRDALSCAGCELLVCPGIDHAQRLAWLLDELGRRKMTNVLVEGGGRLLGAMFDAGEMDEIHTFIAPKIAGGANAPTAVGGAGVDLMAESCQLDSPTVEVCGTDVYIHGRVSRP